jgi:hypothetical protein
MAQQKEISSELQELGERLKEFREAHPVRTRLPEELWSSAAKLAGKEGLYQTARILRLDYSDLKRRVEGSTSSRMLGGRTSSMRRAAKRKAPAERRARRRKKRVAAPAFVELLGESIVGGGSTDSDCVIEVEGASGARMRIRTRMSAAEVVGLIGEWRERTAERRGERA